MQLPVILQKYGCHVLNETDSLFASRSIFPALQNPVPVFLKILCQKRQILCPDHQRARFQGMHPDRIVFVIFAIQKSFDLGRVFRDRFIKHAERLFQKRFGMKTFDGFRIVKHINLIIKRTDAA